MVYNTDCKNQVKAYVNDMCQYLDVANKENKRILEKNNLIWYKSDLIYNPLIYIHLIISFH